MITTIFKKAPLMAYFSNKQPAAVAAAQDYILTHYSRLGGFHPVAKLAILALPNAKVICCFPKQAAEQYPGLAKRLVLPNHDGKTWNTIPMSAIDFLMAEPDMDITVHVVTVEPERTFTGSGRLEKALIAALKKFA